MDSMIYNKMLHTPICTGKPWEESREEQAGGGHGRKQRIQGTAGTEVKGRKPGGVLQARGRAGDGAERGYIF